MFFEFRQGRTSVSAFLSHDLDQLAEVFVMTQESSVTDHEEERASAGDGSVEHGRVGEKPQMVSFVLADVATRGSDRREDNDVLLAALDILDSADVDLVEALLAQLFAQLLAMETVGRDNGDVFGARVSVAVHQLGDHPHNDSDFHLIIPRRRRGFSFFAARHVVKQEGWCGLPLASSLAATVAW